MRERTSASQACGSTPFILAVMIRLYIDAARLPPRSDASQSSFGGIVGETHAPILKEQSKARPSLQDVIERFGQVVPTGELGELFAHVGVKILGQRPAQRSPNGQTLFDA